MGPAAHRDHEAGAKGSSAALDDTASLLDSSHRPPVSPGLPRAFDLVCSALGLLALSPLLAVVALAVAVSSRGPILFRQTRIGYHGRPFTFYKFRSMRVAQEGLPLTASGDRRVTRVGRWLRKLKLDELPELFNVLRGDMALVGPRPEVPRYVDLDDPLWRHVLGVRPGLTDPVTLRLRNEEELLGALAGDPDDFYTSSLLPFKLRGYRGYILRRSWRSDLWVLWTTILGILLPGRNPPPTQDEISSLWGGDEAAGAETAPSQGFFEGHRRQAQFLLDLGVLAAAFVLAYLLRFEFRIPADEQHNLLIQLPYVLVLQLAAYFLTGIHNFAWRYISLSEVQAFLRAGIYSAIPLLILRFALQEPYQSWRVPLSVIVLNAILGFGGLLGLRVIWRMRYEHRRRQRRLLVAGAQAALPVLLVGAGQAGILATRELDSRGDVPLDIRGFVDDDPSKQGLVIRGVRVLGTTDDLPRLVASHKVDHVIITIAEPSPLELGRIMAICQKIPVGVRIIPGLHKILEGSLRMEAVTGDAGEAPAEDPPPEGTAG
ncbi:MAG: sugar transferase [Acidobacteriota bacterium]|nr:sugar transferase [Acidobacteriota bacterium]